MTWRVKMTKTPRICSEIPGYWALPEEDQRAVDELMRKVAESRKRAKAKGEHFDSSALLAEMLRTMNKESE